MRKVTGERETGATTHTRKLSHPVAIFVKHFQLKWMRILKFELYNPIPYSIWNRVRHTHTHQTRLLTRGSLDLTPKSWDALWQQLGLLTHAMTVFYIYIYINNSILISQFYCCQS